MVLVIDNYDSFTYNLVQYLGELGVTKLEVRRNDAVDVGEIPRMRPSHIVISPGPCTPDDAGITLELIAHSDGQVPILGVCLGHQAIGQVFGARVVRSERPMHGKTSPVFHDGTGLHRGLPSPFIATRYHSLTLAAETIPECLVVDAWTEDGEVMGIRHRDRPLFGVQYHPESIMTDTGRDILRNFLAVR